MDFAALLRAEKEKAKGTSIEGNKSMNTENNAKTIEEDVYIQHTELKTFDFEPRKMIGLAPYRTCPGIKRVYYIPKWISLNEEIEILNRVNNIPISKWIQLKQRRLQVYGGNVTTKYEPSMLPSWLQVLADALVDMGIFLPLYRPNHALINEYTRGNGILPHEDGPMYYPLVAIVSLGANARMTFQRHRQILSSEMDIHELQIDRCSLLIFTDEAYTEHLHSIDAVDGTRVSLTIRFALKNPSNA